MPYSGHDSNDIVAQRRQGFGNTAIRHELLYTAIRRDTIERQYF